MANSRDEYPDLSKSLNSNEDQYPDLSKPLFQRSFASKLPANILAGLAQMGHGLINAPHNISNVFSPEIAAKIPKQQDYNYPEMLNLPKNATMADKLIRGIAQYAPAMVMPAAEIGVAGEASGLLPRMAAQAVPQAAFGATQNENPIAGAEEGALSGAGGEAVYSGLEGIYNALKPSRLFRGNLSKEELQNNLEATEGTDTALGRVIESPNLNRIYENVLPHVIGSGAEDTMQKTASQVTEKGKDLLENIKGNLDSEDMGIKLKSALKQAASDARVEKNTGFEKLNKIADDAGLKIGRENFQNTASNVLQEIGQSPELKAEFTPELYKDLQRYASNPEGNNLKLTNIFRGKLGDKANDLYQAGKMHEYGIVNSLKDSLSKDIQDSFDLSGNKELQNAYEQNQKDYAEKFAPFEDKDIVKFTRKGGDPDLILSHFIRGGKNDRATILSKITELAHPQYKSKNDLASLMTYGYLSKAVDKDGNFDPIKLSTLYRNLGEKQKKALFKDEKMRNDLEKYSNLVGKTKESFDLMRNPKTGSRNTELLSKVAQIAGGAAIGLPVIKSLILGAVSGRIGKNLLTSEKTRTNLIKKMLEEKNAKMPERKILPGLMSMELNTYKGTE